MIGYLSGKILTHDSPNMIVLVGGVGYELFVGKTAHGFPHAGSETEVYVHTYVREDQITLYGFPSPLVKRIFLVLLGVNGVGPKLAYGVVEQLEPAELIDAISAGNTKLLTTISGIGKKMAERMVLELREKITSKIGPLASSGATPVVTSGSQDQSMWRDLTEALVGLGFPDHKIRNVIKLVRQEHQVQQLNLDAALKFALKKIGQC